MMISSSTTARATCKPAFVSRDQSDTESLDDEALKNKIQEANQLINEVKKALGKIKAVENYDTGGRPSSTDIEETIRNLKKEAARLITGGDNESNKYSEARPTLPETPRNSLEQNLVKADIPSVSKQVPHEDYISSSGACLAQPEEPRNSLEQNVIDDIPSFSQQLPCGDPISFSEELIRKSTEKIQIEDQIRNLLGKPDSERPKTRRNEAEDELSEQLCREKFRNCPETGILTISSSFEELQEKLQTISETTESNNSTPRKKSIEPIKEQNSKGCTTTYLMEDKEIQVKPNLVNVGVGCCCSTKEKNIQVNPQKKLSMEATTTTTTSLSPKRRSLDSTYLPLQEIKPIRKCPNCRIERLPTIETVAPLTKPELKMVHIGADSWPTKAHNKVLAVQRLPDIIIEPGLTLTPVLNLSISPVGQSKNDVENTGNIQYVEIVHSFANGDEKEVSCRTLFVDCTKNTEEESVVIPVLSKKSLDNAGKSISKLVKWQKDKWSELLKSHRMSENEAAGLLKEYKLGIDFDSKLTPEEEEDMQQKLLCYKSYHIYDNPNKHDPGELTAKSISKFSQMDIDVYKTFINPNPNTADEEYFATSGRNLRNTKYYFESKAVQCSDSEVITPEAIPPKSSDSEEIELKAEFSKVDKATSTLDIIPEEVTQVHLFEDSGLDKTSSLLPASQRFTETVLNVKEKSEESIESSTTDGNSSLSEITLTISYTLSSESSQNSKEITEKENSKAEIIPTAANSKISNISKTFSVADKDIISRLQNKLKSIDTQDSNPMFTMNKNSENQETLDNFLKGLTNFEEREESRRQSRVEGKSKDEQIKEDRKIKKEHQQHKEPKIKERKSDDQTRTNKKPKQKHHKDTENKPSQEPLTDLKQKNNPTVNYLIQQKMSEDPFKHLELAKNGRYKDEKDLFTNIHYPIEKYIKWPGYPKDISDVKATLEQKDKEVSLDKFRTIPRDIFKRHSPDTSNSDTVTANSVSEGEILCRHSISNGEIHVCRPRLPAVPRFRLSKSSITKRHLSYMPKYRCPHSHCHKVSSPRRFDLNDPTVSIEQRRNYFNNWVTYYVQSQAR